MQAVIIFAGLSSRFWPLTEKCFWRVCGKTILEHQLERLRDAGIKEFILVGGKHNLMLARGLQLNNVTFVEQKDDCLGMREAFLSALPQCKDKPVLLINSNDLVEAAAYSSIINKMADKKIDGVLLAKPMDRYFPGGYLTVDKVGRVTSIIEKPGAGKEPSKLVNIVAHAHRSASVLLRELEKTKSKKDDGYELALDRLFKKHRYEVMPYIGRWQAIKYPWHLLGIAEMLLSDIRKQSIHKSASIHPSAVISGPVIMEENVRVMAHATIVGPCFIGKNSIIANNALVRHSSIGERCIVGFTTEIVRSVLASDVWTHMSYVGDSIIDQNTSLAAGTFTGNLRLDEQEISSVVKTDKVATGLTKFGAVIGSGVRTGIHCAIAPGVKIGTGSFLDSATMIDVDIPDHSFVKWKKGELEVRPNRTKGSKPQDREKFRKKV